MTIPPGWSNRGVLEVHKPYRYIGPDSYYQGETALGWNSPNSGFLIQIDRLSHPQSHGWHRGIREHWEER